MKKIFFLMTLIFLILILSVNPLFSEDVKFTQNKDSVAISFDIAPRIYKVDFYNYGMNIIAKGMNINKLRIYKFQNDVIVRTIPLDKEKSLIKIQYPIKNLEQHIKIYDKDRFIINIYKNKISQSAAEKKSPPTQKTEKSIVDEAKELSLINTVPVEKTSDTLPNTSFNRKNKEEKFNEVTAKKREKPSPSSSEFIVNKDESGFSKNVIKTYSILFVLCIFILLGAFLLKKFYGKFNPTISRGVIKILYKKDISMKKSIAITKILNDYYILGITQHSISYIDKINADSIIEELKLIEGEKEKDKFIKYLKKEEKKEETVQNDDKDKMIKMIQVKLKEYKNNFNNVS